MKFKHNFTLSCIIIIISIVNCNIWDNIYSNIDSKKNKIDYFNNILFKSRDGNSKDNLNFKVMYNTYFNLIKISIEKLVVKHTSMLYDIEFYIDLNNLEKLTYIKFLFFSECYIEKIKSPLKPLPLNMLLDNYNLFTYLMYPEGNNKKYLITKNYFNIKNKNELGFQLSIEDILPKNLDLYFDEFLIKNKLKNLRFLDNTIDNNTFSNYSEIRKEADNKAKNDSIAEFELDNDNNLISFSAYYKFKDNIINLFQLAPTYLDVSFIREDYIFKKDKSKCKVTSS